MKKHISTVVVFFTSLMGFLFLGLPFYTELGKTYNGYYFLEPASKLMTKDVTSAYNLVKVAVIFLIVLFSVALVYSVVKLLIDLNVIKIKNTAWTEWVNLGLVVVIAIFSIIALCGVNNFIDKATLGASAAELKEWGVGVGYGAISALIVYCLTLAVEIAWVVVLSLKKSNNK